MENTEIIWQPSNESKKSSNLSQFIELVNQRHSKSIKTEYQDIWDWSVTNVESFWSLIWDFSEIKGHKGSKISENLALMPGAKFFPDAKIIVIERDPCNVFPSTLALQKLLFNIATDIPISNIEKKSIYKILEDFRLNLQLTLVKKKTLPFKVIRFNDLINTRELVLEDLLKWINCENVEISKVDKTVHKTKALYKPLNNIELIKILRNPWPVWPKETYLSNLKN